MTDDCFRRADCRLCGSPDLTEVLSLAPTPPANAFVPADARATEQPTFPLDVFFCEACGHVQLRDVVDPRVLFENYVYVSGTSPVFVKHFQDYAAAVLARARPGPGAWVLDIGSNDGTLLRFFQQAGLGVLGVDPARDIAGAATEAATEAVESATESATEAVEGALEGVTGSGDGAAEGATGAVEGAVEDATGAVKNLLGGGD